MKQEEIRQSRIKQTKRLILEHNFAGLLNNQKWFRIFDWLNMNSIDFHLKTLNSSDKVICKFIRELEKSSILIDDSGNFIEFLEIESITIKKTDKILFLLKELNVDYSACGSCIDINGYRK